MYIYSVTLLEYSFETATQVFHPITERNMLFLFPVDFEQKLTITTLRELKAACHLINCLQ